MDLQKKSDLLSCPSHRLTLEFVWWNIGTDVGRGVSRQPTADRWKRWAAASSLFPPHSSRERWKINKHQLNIDGWWNGWKRSHLCPTNLKELWTFMLTVSCYFFILCRHCWHLTRQMIIYLCISFISLALLCHKSSGKCFQRPETFIPSTNCENSKYLSCTKKTRCNK